jgi:hypothetical protein
MSFHYSVCISTHLRRDLLAVDVALLDWLYNSNGDSPTIPPEDELRSVVLESDWLRDYLAAGADPAMASRFEISRMPGGDIIDASLMMFSPGNKLEGIFDEWLRLLRWLASLVAADGHFATVICEDGGHAPPFLFYSCGGRLFMKSEKEMNVVHSVDSEERRVVPTR